MKYLKLQTKLSSGGKEKKIKFLKKEDSEKPLRDIIAEHLYTFLTIEKNNGKNPMNQQEYIQKSFPTLEEQKKLNKVKERIVFSDNEIVEMGNELFEFIKTNLKFEGFTAENNDVIVGLSEMIDQCDKQIEEEAEKEFKANKDKKPITIKKYYEQLGYKIEFEEKK